MSEKVYTTLTDQGELSESEKAELSRSILTQCEGKPLRRAVREEVDDVTYNTLSQGDIVMSNNTRRSRSIPGCDLEKVS